MRSLMRIAAAAAAAALVLPATATSATDASVDGSIMLDSAGNRLSISARTFAGGGVTGHAVLQTGLRGIHNGNAPQIFRIRITCFIRRSEDTVVVGGETEGASSGTGTAFPFYSFVLQDRGRQLPDRYVLYAQVSGVCTEASGEPVETAQSGNIVIH